MTRFAQSRRGATAIEYGLIASGIIVATIAVIGLTGTRLEKVFGRISAPLSPASHVQYNGGTVWTSQGGIAYLSNKSLFANDIYAGAASE